MCEDFKTGQDLGCRYRIIAVKTFVEMFAEVGGGVFHLVTIKDVASRAGVSISTVSRSLSGNIPVSEKTRTKVDLAVKELGYWPNAFAQALKNGKSRAIGLIIPNFRSLVFPELIKGISDIVNKHGYTLVLCNTEEDLDLEKQYVDNLRRRLIDGLIISTATGKSTHLLDLKEESFPLVLVIRHLEDKVDAVIADNFLGAYDGTRLLISRGYRRICFINGSMELDLYRRRFAGYRKAMQESGVYLDDALLVHGTDSWEDGYHAMCSILDGGDLPEAVFAASDPKAYGVIKAIRERGFNIPGEIAVLGFDNMEMSALTEPPLTTMAQSFYDMGAKAAQRLIRLINARGKLKTVVDLVPVQVVMRSSVGSMRGQT